MKRSRTPQSSPAKWPLEQRSRQHPAEPQHALVGAQGLGPCGSRGAGAWRGLRWRWRASWRSSSTASGSTAPSSAGAPRIGRCRRRARRPRGPRADAGPGEAADSGVQANAARAIYRLTGPTPPTLWQVDPDHEEKQEPRDGYGSLRATTQSNGSSWPEGISPAAGSGGSPGLALAPGCSLSGPPEGGGSWHAVRRAHLTPPG